MMEGAIHNIQVFSRGEEVRDSVGKGVKGSKGNSGKMQAAKNRNGIVQRSKSTVRGSDSD